MSVIPLQELQYQPFHILIYLDQKEGKTYQPYLIPLIQILCHSRKNLYRQHKQGIRKIFKNVHVFNFFIFVHIKENYLKNKNKPICRN